MIVPYFIPRSVEDEDMYMDDVNGYLQGRCFFEIKRDMAFFMAPVKLFPQLDLDISFKEVLYCISNVFV